MDDKKSKAMFVLKKETSSSTTGTTPTHDSPVNLIQLALQKQNEQRSKQLQQKKQQQKKKPKKEGQIYSDDDDSSSDESDSDSKASNLPFLAAPPKYSALSSSSPNSNTTASLKSSANKKAQLYSTNGNKKPNTVIATATPTATSIELDEIKDELDDDDLMNLDIIRSNNNNKSSSSKTSTNKAHDDADSSDFESSSDERATTTTKQVQARQSKLSNKQSPSKAATTTTKSPSKASPAKPKTTTIDIPNTLKQWFVAFDELEQKYKDSFDNFIEESDLNRMDQYEKAIKSKLKQLSEDVAENTISPHWNQISISEHEEKYNSYRSLLNRLEVLFSKYERYTGRDIKIMNKSRKFSLERKQKKAALAEENDNKWKSVQSMDDKRAVSFFVEKFGPVEGKRRWQEFYQAKQLNATTGMMAEYIAKDLRENEDKMKVSTLNLKDKSSQFSPINLDSDDDDESRQQSPASVSRPGSSSASPSSSSSSSTFATAKKNDNRKNKRKAASMSTADGGEAGNNNNNNNPEKGATILIDDDEDEAIMPTTTATATTEGQAEEVEDELTATTTGLV